MVGRWCGAVLLSVILCACGSAAEKKASYVEMAKALIQDKKIPKARVALKNALKIDPQDARALLLMDQVSEKDGNWSRALADNKKAVQLPSNHRETNGQTIPLKRETLWNLLPLNVSKQQWDQAAQALSLPQHTNINALTPLAELINLYLEKKQPEQAQAYLEKILALYPNHSFASGLLGAVLWELKDKHAALSAFRKQTQVNPNWIDPWKDWASLQWTEGNRVQALKILKTAVTQNPNSLVLLNTLASYYQASGQIDLAIEHYKEVLRHHPEDLIAANNLAYLLADERGDTQSLKLALSLTQQFEAKTQSPFLLDTLAWVYYKSGLPKEATSVLKKALSKIPEHGLINYHFGLITLKVGDRINAARHLEKAVEKLSDPEDLKDARRLLATIQLQIRPFPIFRRTIFERSA